MCRRVTCEKCGKATFAGCGAHVEQVLAGVPPEQRCRCREDAANERTRAAPAAKRRGWAWWRREPD